MTRKLSPGKIVIASHNQGKVSEIDELLGPYGMEPICAADLGLPEPDETEDSFLGNALIKARAAVAGSRLVSLADDSGLMVDALGGAPGVYTADWAERQTYEGPPGRDWYMAMGKVEGKLAELGPDTARTAHFVSTLVLAWPDGDYAVFEGRASGTLVWPPRGRYGFGYDPVFQPLGQTLTFGEMAPKEKRAMNHRALAFAKLVTASF
ncbi:MAG: non-canonical purine NTP pyrophosphatase [Sphingomonadaceae bacterium]